MFYSAHERFDRDDGDRWVDYLRWLGRGDLRRVVTLDGMLCPPVVTIEDEDAWDFAVQEDFMLDFFTDLPFVLEHAARFPRAMVLASIRNPSAEQVTDFTHPEFDFAGFDLLDIQCCASPLLDCGGYPEIFLPEELSPGTGLLRDLARANEIRDRLYRLEPYDFHADCNVWAIWVYAGSTPPVARDNGTGVVDPSTST